MPSFSHLLKLKIPVFTFLIGLSGLHPMTTKAQKLEFNGEFLLFREAKTKQPVLIVNDSLVYKGNAMKRIPFKHTEYPAKLQEYIFFNIDTKTYLVHDGCGPVLEFRNDSIVRIDNSFLHRSQFGAAKFVYNNEIYFFGGYGLFTTKNILTKYNFKSKEWIEVQTYGVKAQEPRVGAFSYIKENELYIFGGAAKDENDITEDKPLDNKVWRLHLPSMQWNCVGKFNENLKKNEVEIIGQNKHKLCLIRQHFIELDFYSNKIHTYNRNYFPKILSCYLDGKKIIGVYAIGATTFFYSGDLNEFKGNLKSSSVFITPLVDYDYYIKIILISLLALALLVYLFRTPLSSIFKPFNGIVYDKSKQQFIYKGRTILIFEDQEVKIVLYLLDNLNQYVSLNELNQLFENNGNTETISAIVKRREQAVSGLLTKVSRLTGIEEKELILERKNSKDKRIKDLKLLPNLLKMKN
ncbi:MAG: hypothetical protein RIT03_767 [Bacteroidota bacterium]